MTNIIPNSGGATDVIQYSIESQLTPEDLNQRNQNILNSIANKGSKVYVSPQQSMSNIENNFNFTHGLGKKPDVITFILHCVNTTSTNFGLIAGDRILFKNLTYSMRITITDTHLQNVYINRNLNFRSPAGNSISLSSVNNNNFKWTIEAIAF